jgi:hypothetical protein
VSRRATGDISRAELCGVSYMPDTNTWSEREDMFLGSAYLIATDVHILRIEAFHEEHH